MKRPEFPVGEKVMNIIRSLFYAVGLGWVGAYKVSTLCSHYITNFYQPATTNPDEMTNAAGSA